MWVAEVQPNQNSDLEFSAAIIVMVMSMTVMNPQSGRSL